MPLADSYLFWLMYIGNLKFQMRFASHNALSFYDIPELKNNMHFLQASSPGAPGTPKELVLRLFLRLHIFQVSQPPAPLTTRFKVDGTVLISAGCLWLWPAGHRFSSIITSSWIVKKSDRYSTSGDHVREWALRFTLVTCTGHSITGT